MRRLVAGITAIAAAAAPAGAQEPRPPPQTTAAAGPSATATPGEPGPGAPAVAVGDSFDYLTSHGRRLRMTLTGIDDAGGTASDSGDAPAGPLYRWELSDITATPRLAARILQDPAFRILSYAQADGATTRYEPNNCEKVVGMCRYTVHQPDGGTAREMRVNGIESGVWNYSLWKERDGALKPVGVGEICYDAAGVSLTETWTDLENPGGYAIRRIRSDGSLAECADGGVVPQ